MGGKSVLPTQRDRAVNGEKEGGHAEAILRHECGVTLAKKTREASTWEGKGRPETHVRRSQGTNEKF